MPRFRGAVEFWNERSLEDELNGTGVTLDLKISNTEASYSLLKITHSLIEIISHKTEVNPSLYDKTEMMNLLWDMKDRVVTVHECLRQASNLFERVDIFSTIPVNTIHHFVGQIFDFIYLNGLHQIEAALTDRSPSMSLFLHRVYTKTQFSSNWAELYSFRVGLIPGYVIPVHDRVENDRLEMQGSLPSGNPMGIRLNRNPSSLVAAEDASNLIKAYAIWVHGLEGMIDDAFSECILGIE